MEAFTERLHVRDVGRGDLEAMVALWMDNVVKQGMGTWGPQTEDEVLPWIDDAMKHNQAEPRFTHNSVIVERSSELAAGWIGFGPPSQGKEEWGDLDFGYSMRPELRGRGYATEALSAVIEFCFTKVGINSFFGETMPDNLASARVMEKAGMKIVGVQDDGHIVYRIERTTLNRTPPFIMSKRNDRGHD